MSDTLLINRILKKGIWNMKEKTKYMIIGGVIALVFIILALIFGSLISSKNSNGEKFYSNLEIFKDYFQENYGSEEETFIVSGDWINRTIIVTLKENQIDYENCANYEKDELFKERDKEYCDDIINPMIEEMNEKGWDEENIEYTFLIVDKNNKEIVKYVY